MMVNDDDGGDDNDGDYDDDGNVNALPQSLHQSI